MPCTLLGSGPTLLAVLAAAVPAVPAAVQTVMSLAGTVPTSRSVQLNSLQHVSPAAATCACCMDPEQTASSSCRRWSLMCREPPCAACIQCGSSNSCAHVACSACCGSCDYGALMPTQLKGSQSLWRAIISLQLWAHNHCGKALFRCSLGHTPATHRFTSSLVTVLCM